MQSYKIVLFGHRDLYCYNKLEKDLYMLLKALAQEKDFLEIYLGRDGDFDIVAFTVVKRVQREIGKGKIRLILVLPHEEKGMKAYEGDYDGVIHLSLPPEAYLLGPQIKRDRWMLEICDLAVCCVTHERDTAHALLTYTGKLGKKCINLARTAKKEWALCF